MLIGTVVTTAGVVYGVLRRTSQDAQQTRTVDAQAIVDQIQEERAAADTRHQREIDHLEGRYLRELTDVRTEMHELRGRQTRIEGRELVLLDYVAALRHHIDQGLGPPPPPWPTALTNRAEEPR